jgi:opacity protein-like surface antigen
MLAADYDAANAPQFQNKALLGSRINYIGTVRARIGYACDRFLVYGTGVVGYAAGRAVSSCQKTSRAVIARTMIDDTTGMRESSKLCSTARWRWV